MYSLQSCSIVTKTIVLKKDNTRPRRTRLEWFQFGWWSVSCRCCCCWKWCPAVTGTDDDLMHKTPMDAAEFEPRLRFRRANRGLAVAAASTVRDLQQPPQALSMGNRSLTDWLAPRSARYQNSRVPSATHGFQYDRDDMEFSADYNGQRYELWSSVNVWLQWYIFWDEALTISNRTSTLTDASFSTVPKKYRFKICLHRKTVS